MRKYVLSQYQLRLLIKQIILKVYLKYVKNNVKFYLEDSVNPIKFPYYYFFVLHGEKKAICNKKKTYAVSLVRRLPLAASIPLLIF